MNRKKILTFYHGRNTYRHSINTVILSGLIDFRAFIYIAREDLNIRFFNQLICKDAQRTYALL